jgi:hypothetical protein
MHDGFLRQTGVMREITVACKRSGRELECCKCSSQGLDVGEAPYSVSALFACMLESVPPATCASAALGVYSAPLVRPWMST